MPAFSSKWTVFLLVVLAGVLIWNQFRELDDPRVQETQRQLPKAEPSPPPARVESPPPATAETPAPSVPVAAAPAVAVTPLPATAPPIVTGVLPGSVNETPAAPGDIAEDLSAVDTAIRSYQTVHGENPIGSNAEITTALFVNNPKQLKLEVPAGSHVNGEGQLCDRWGTPYFFHQVSATEMEIRSAGPDRKMWTGDDSQI